MARPEPRPAPHPGRLETIPTPSRAATPCCWWCLEFESAAALNKALFSPGRAKARLDFQSFPAFTGVVTHQAMTGEEAWRKK
jgi:hypothetical protein